MQKQSNLINYAESLGVVVDDIENYINKESVIHCRCKNGHLIQGSVDYLLKTSFECLECEKEKQKNITFPIDKVGKRGYSNVINKNNKQY